MSRSLRYCFAPALTLAVALVGPGLAAAMAAVPEPRVDAYVTADDTPYFALRLTPNVAFADSAPRDVVVLVDTSASQAGAIREKGLAALRALVSGLRDGDRVCLLAVDLEAVPLSDGFVGAASDSLKRALAALERRTPLGATDLMAGLHAAAASFDANSQSPRVLVYLGDGMSAARYVTLDEYRALVDKLTREQISVLSYAVGPRADAQQLAALANATGGMLAIDGDDVTAQQSGAFLATAVHGSVFWPSQVTWPAAFAEVYPARIPPLRSDRDTVVLGRAEPGRLAGRLEVDMTAEAGRQPRQLHWTLDAGASNPDFAFLPVLVEGARHDDGLRLITLGSAGLQEARRMLDESIELLGKLSRQALVSGNHETAERLANEALRRDPADELARSVKEQLARLRADGGVAVGGPPQGALEGDKLEVKRFSSEQAAPPTASAATAPAAAVPPPPRPALFDDVNEGEGRLLADIEQHNRLVTDQIRAEVNHALREARSLMSTDPSAVEQSLKLVLQRVVQTPELRAETRAQLRGQLESALREAARVGATKDILDQQREEARAAAVDRLRIANELVRKQDKIQQLMDRFNSLMEEGRYVAADEIGDFEMARLAPELPISTSAALTAHMTGARQADLALRLARQKAVIDTLGTVEVSLMPFPDDQPVVYPPADVWEELSIRRRKFAETDLRTVSPGEKKIRDALVDPRGTKMDFIETPLREVIDYLKDYHDIEIQLHTSALRDVAIDPEQVVTINVNGITLKSGLRLLLRDMDLSYMIKDEVLLITTPDVVNNPENMVTKAYPVADLVIPVQSGGGMGGGSMGGGMMGGMGGGGMGGMGGGMFAVPDDLKLGPKAKQSAGAPAKAQGAVAQPAPARSAKAPAVPAAKAQPIALEIAPGVDPTAAWSDYLASHGDVSAAAIRETARHLMQKRKYGELVGLLHATLRRGDPQPWMYEAMALAMQAAGSPTAEIERALMSGVDFSQSTDDLLYVAQYMARCGLEARALQVFRQVTELDPLRPEPYLYGLQLAERLHDLDAIRWSSLGILRQAWPTSKAAIVESARRSAAAAVEQLRAANRGDEADGLQAEIDRAAVRDLVVRVTWTGDADVDILVEEPSGTVCEFRHPRTSGGGVMLGDTSSVDRRAAGDGASEVYECPLAFAGRYRVLVRRVWGKVTAGKVTVDVYAHYGTPEQKHVRQQIALGDDDAMVVFELPEGRRQEPLEEQQLANAAAGQLAVNQAILAQQVASMSESSQGANASLGSSRQDFFGLPVINQAVGYQPQITVLPSGTGFFVSGVVSADRRYVRVTPVPQFTGVSSVTTFNLITGGTSGPAQ